MKLNLKEYKLLKIKKYIQNSKYFLIYNSLNTKNPIKISQELNKLNSKYFKVFNTLTKKILEKSIYKNFRSIINGLIIIVQPKKNTISLPFKTLNNIDILSSIIAIKVNSKIYPVYFLDQSLQLDYKKDNFILVRSLKEALKTTFKLTQKST